jgi:hypothetical protein
MTVLRVNTTTNVIRVSPVNAKVIAAARQGPPGPSGTQQINTDGIGTGTTTIASILLSAFCSVKWFIQVSDPTNSLKRWSEIGAMKSVTSGLQHTEYGILGDAIPYTLDVVEVSGSMELQLTNTGGDPLDARVVQIAVTV